jgi:hypothetical protein
MVTPGRVLARLAQDELKAVHEDVHAAERQLVLRLAGLLLRERAGEGLAKVDRPGAVPQFRGTVQHRCGHRSGALNAAFGKRQAVLKLQEGEELFALGRFEPDLAWRADDAPLPVVAQIALQVQR